MSKESKPKTGLRINRRPIGGLNGGEDPILALLRQEQDAEDMASS
jgi:hypothetical protein